MAVGQKTLCSERKTITAGWSAPLRGYIAKGEDFGAIDETPISIDHIASKPDSFPDHLLGAPIVDFLRALGLKTNKNPFREFLKNLQLSERSLLACAFSKGAKQKVSLQTYKLESVFTKIRDALSVSEQKSYDALWKRINMPLPSI